MNIPTFSATRRADRSLKQNRLLATGLLAVAAIAIGMRAAAQQVVMSTPDVPLLPPVVRPTEVEAAKSGTDLTQYPTKSSINWNGFKLQPHLFASIVHADGLPISGTTRATTEILTFAPGLLVDLGPHWTVDYTATALNYSDGALRDTVNHDFRVVGANRSPDWRLQLAEGYSVYSSIMAETAQQTKQKTWSNALQVGHDFGNLLHYLGTFGMTDTKTENFVDTRDWATEQWVRATVSQKVDAGVGLGVGYSEIVAQPDSHYEKYLGELKWRTTDKLSLSVQAGWENFHSLSAAIGDARNPILEASLLFQPFEQTRFVASNSHVISNSLFGRSYVDSKRWSVSLNQRLLGKLYLNLGYSRNSADYTAGAGTALLGRADEVKTFSGSLSVALFTDWTIAGTFQSSKNDSNQADFRYSSSQYGLQLSGRF